MVCVLAVAFLIVGAAAPARAAEHVVVIVCDGLRPDLVTERDMPTLSAIRQAGVDFANHHPGYLSSTEVNGTILSTGSYPRNSGLVANHEYRPDVDLLRDVETQSDYAIWRTDVVRKTPYLHADTLAEILRAAGKRTAVAGTKPIALLWDRKPRKPDSDSINLFEGRTVPSAFLDRITESAGPLPLLANPKKAANAEQDRWTTHALTDSIWKSGVPAFTVLWMSEPDFAQHGSGPGTTVGRAALRSCDQNIKAVRDALEAQGALDTTDLLVVSDHGFSTVSRQVDVVEELKPARLNIVREFDDADSAKAPGRILAVTNGGSVCFYVTGRDPATLAKLVKALQDSSFAGVIFTREATAGTFALGEARIDAPDAPDVVVSLRWADERWRPGLPKGTLFCDGKYVPGQGHHASLSRYDMHNTLIAAGPDFRKGFRSDLPSGNVDVAPTILRLLSVSADAAARMDGRVLAEALNDDVAPHNPAQPPRTFTLTGDNGNWHQFLKITEYDGRRYLDEGNRLDDPNAAPPNQVGSAR
ncbi:MAG TPA: alkaline phosphatase family protein [Tepidisphaeraceae bacterium]